MMTLRYRTDRIENHGNNYPQRDEWETVDISQQTKTQPSKTFISYCD